MKDYPQSQAVLVRRHGVYVWGTTWIQAKTQAECYDYLFESAVKMKAIGIDVSKPAASALVAAANGTAHQNGHANGDLLDPRFLLPAKSVISFMSALCRKESAILLHQSCRLEIPVALCSNVRLPITSCVVCFWETELSLSML